MVKWPDTHGTTLGATEEQRYVASEASKRIMRDCLRQARLEHSIDEALEAAVDEVAHLAAYRYCRAHQESVLI